MKTLLLKKNFLAILIGIALISAGTLLAVLSHIAPWQPEQTAAGDASIGKILSASSNINSPPKTVSGKPIHINIPDLSISLDVTPGYYNSYTNSWTLTLDKAQYASVLGPTSSKSGETFIYAHYRKGVFYNLPQIKPGMEAKVTTDNGHVFTYTYRTNAVVSPTNTEFLRYSGSPILVAQTCTGSWFQNRQLFIFDLTKVT